jgi:hypothetical protein
MLSFQVAVLDCLPKCGLTRFTCPLQSGSLSVDVRVPVPYGPVRTNVFDHPQASCIHAELQSDPGLRKMDVDHERRVDARLSAWEALRSSTAFAEMTCGGSGDGACLAVA